MKSRFRILMMVLPLVMFVQEKDVALAKDQPGATASVIEATSVTTVDESVPSETSPSAGAVSAPADTSFSALPQNNKPAPSPAPDENGSPKIGSSMVGYIDNPIVGSELRIRFDAGFHDNYPDNGEFFYAKCGCYKILNGNYAYDPNAPGPAPGVVTNLDFQQLYLRAEYAPMKRFSVFFELPIRWIEPLAFVNGPGTFPNQSGLGDVEGGFKLALLTSYNHALTVQLASHFPSGDAARGLGTAHYTVEPQILYYQRISGRMALEAEVGDTHPIGGSAGVPVTSSNGFAADVFNYGVGPSYTVYRGESVTVTPVLEMVGWHEFGGYETVWLTGSDIANYIGGTNIVNLKLGVRTSFGRSSIYAGYGMNVTYTHWYRNIVRVEYRYSF